MNLFGAGVLVAHCAGQAGLAAAKVAGDVCYGRERISWIALPALPLIGIEENSLPFIPGTVYLYIWNYLFPEKLDIYK